MTKQIRSKRPARTVAPVEAPRKLWLASLGVFAIAQRQSEKLVETLVEEGEQFRGKAEKFVATTRRDARRTAANVQKRVDAVVQPITQGAKRTVKGFESRFGKRIRDALGRMGVPSKRDIQELIGQVDRVKRKVKTSQRRRAA